MSTIESHRYELQLSHYRQIFDSSIDVIYMLEVTPDGDFIYVDVNTAYTKVTGIPREEVIGLNVKQIKDETFRSILIKKFTACLNAGEKTDYIYDYAFPSGIMTFHSILTPLLDENGKIHKIVGVARDVTEQKRIENKIHMSEDKYRTFFESANDGIFLHRIVEENGSVEFILHDLNQRGCVLWDHSKEDILSGNLDLLTIGEHPYTFEEATKRNRLAANGEPQLFDWQIKHKNGSKIWGEVNLRRIQIGNEPFLLAVIRDITERKQSEQRLQQAIELNEEIINTIPDLLFELDAEGTYLNIWAQDEALLAAQKATLIGKNIRDILPPDAVEASLKTMHQVDEQGQSLGNTMHVDLPEGRKWFELSATKKKSSGTYIVLSREITERKEQEYLLQTTKAKLSAIISTIPDLIWVKDGNGVYMMCNSQYKTFMGVTDDEIIGKTDYDFYETDTADICKRSDLEAIAAGTLTLSYETFINPDSGTNGTWEIRKMPVFNNEEFMGVLGIGRDITERKKIEKLILKNESRLKEAQKIAKVGNWELEFPSLELSWSDEIYRIFEIIPNNEAPNYADFMNAIHPDDRVLVDLAYKQSLSNKTPYDITHRLLMNDGRIKYVHERGETFYDTQGNPLRSIGTAQDVTEQKMVEMKIEYMAHHDALTGLPNRILSKDRTEKAIAYAKSKNSKIAFFFIDLDGFKNINDSMGHSAGDTMLKIVAQRLREILKVGDTIGRQGGDEFLITLSDVNDRSDIITIANRLLKEFEQSFNINDQVLSISASIGIAVYPKNGDTFEALLQNADAAMYAAKASGKNTYSFYTKQMSNNLIKQFKIQNDLKSALKNNEFILHYQPLIDLAQNKITGAEALIRWNHPQLKMIPPLSFIPIAESTGMIVSIGEWVIMEACRQCALWHSQGLEITIAVNISAVQFKRGNLEAIIKNALASSGLNPQYLELELTESILIHDSENVLLAVHALKRLGIKLSIDDFGTGYSSLSYLKRFAVDKLKIDQSFVKDILRDQEDAAIVQTIIQMAKNLNLKTIAEGVEDKNVLAVIESYGCDEVQGYHFAKPMKPLDFEAYCTSF